MSQSHREEVDAAVNRLQLANNNRRVGIRVDSYLSLDDVDLLLAEYRHLREFVDILRTLDRAT